MQEAREIDEYPDLSWLETVQDEEGNIVSSYRYTNDDIKTYGREQIQKWIDEDHARLKAYGRDWHCLGVRAKATVYIPAPGGDGFIIQTIESPGVWGIESDAEESYFEEIFRDEIGVLRHMLESFNVAGLNLLDRL